MREGTKVGRTAGVATALGRQLSNACMNYQFIFHTYLHVSFHHSGINSLRVGSALVLHEQTRIAATTLVWTVVILNSSATSGPLSNGRTLKIIS